MSEKIKVGIIGTGGISNCHFTGYKSRNDVDVVACCDIDFEKGNYFILKYGKYSETILSEGEAMHKFKKAKEQFGSAELVIIRNGKVSRKYNQYVQSRSCVL